MKMVERIFSKEIKIPKNLTLVGLLHDPEGRLGKVTRQVLPFAVENFSEVVIHATRTTDQTFLSSLESLAGSNFLSNLEDPCGQIYLAVTEPAVGSNYRTALRVGLASRGSHLLVIDWDRLCYWATNYPGELALAARRILKNEFVMFARTDRAFRSHPKFQRETENQINQLARQITGIAELDILSGAYGMSKVTASCVLANSKSDNFGIWAELFMLPYLLYGKEGVTIFAVDGLAYEERLKYPELERREFLQRLSQNKADYNKRQVYVNQITGRLKQLAKSQEQNANCN